MFNKYKEKNPIMKLSSEFLVLTGGATGENYWGNMFTFNSLTTC